MVDSIVLLSPSELAEQEKVQQEELLAAYAKLMPKNKPWVALFKPDCLIVPRTGVKGEASLATKHGANLHVIDATTCHGHPEKIDYYMSKGFRIAATNFPENYKPDPFNGATNFGDDVDMIAELKAHILQIMNNTTTRVKSLEQENAELRAKIASVMPDKIEAAKAKRAEAAK